MLGDLTFGIAVIWGIILLKDIRNILRDHYVSKKPPLP